MYISFRVIFVISLTMLLFLASCQKRKDKSKNSFSTNNPQETTIINVWIHGTTFIPSYRIPGWFHCPQGFHKASDLKETSHWRSIMESMAVNDSINFPLNTFYFFGWNGILSFNDRRQAALTLHNGLQHLINHYVRTTGNKPFIRIITHSHGGNVLLNLATIEDSNVIIDEAVLLACPVQLCTAPYVDSPRFKKIYSLFSTMDSIQIMDPQGVYKETRAALKQKGIKNLFSHRLFSCRPNLTQIKVRYNTRGLLHIEFMHKLFLGKLPEILRTINKISHENQIVQPIAFNISTMAVEGIHTSIRHRITSSFK